MGLPHVLVLTVHLVNLLGWMGKGDHSRHLATLLLKLGLIDKLLLEHVGLPKVLDLGVHLVNFWVG